MISEKTRKYNREWELKNRKIRTDYRREYTRENKERINLLRRINYLKNKESVRSRMNEANKRYYQKNKQKVFQYHYNRIINDDFYRFRVRLRSRLYKFLKLKGFNKNCTFNEYIGCTPQQLREHIEKQFKKGMTWTIYGRWHIDHIKPLSLAKTEKDAYKLMHYSNLRPMWAIDNIRKSNKLISQI